MQLLLEALANRLPDDSGARAPRERSVSRCVCGAQVAPRDSDPLLAVRRSRRARARRRVRVSMAQCGTRDPNQSTRSLQRAHHRELLDS